MTMFPTCIPFPSSGNKENIPVTRTEKRTRNNALKDGMKGSKRPLLQRIFSRAQSITVLTKPARTQAHSVPHEARSLPSILNTYSPSPSVRQSRSAAHITILSDLEREKREAHPRSPSSVRQSRPPSHITIISNPEKEKREAHPRSTRRTKNIWNAVAAAHALKRAPTISITPISILKVPTPPPQTPASTPVTPISILKAPTPPPQIPAPARASARNPDSVKESARVKFALSDIVEEICQGVHGPEIGNGADTTMASSGEMLDVPIVDWRGRLDEDELPKYYPKEHAEEQFIHRLRSMVRSANRQAAARRRDHARQLRQIVTTSPTITISPSIDLPCLPFAHPEAI